MATHAAGSYSAAARLDARLRALALVAIPFIAAGWTTLIISAIYFTKPGIIYMISNVIPLHLGPILGVFAAVVVGQTQTPARDIGRRRHRLYAVFHTLAAAVAFTLFITFAIGAEQGGWVLSLCVLLCNGFSLAALWLRRRHTVARRGQAPARAEEPAGLALLDTGGGANAGRQKHPHMSQAFAVASTCIAICAFLFLALLLGGASILAHGTAAYPPRGDIAAAALADGRTQRILYHCEGPANASVPVTVIDADGSHGLADFWPLQREFTRAGRRSCIFDKPGLGWSDLYYADQGPDPMSFYPSFIDELPEAPPFAFVGWGGGAEIVHNYAMLRPEQVASLTYLEAYGAGIEWRAPAHVRGYSQQQLQAVKDADISGRRGLFGLIRGIAVPWGLIELFLGGPEGYAWPERYPEYHWFYVTAKTWTTQWFYLLRYAAAPTCPTCLGAIAETTPQLVSQRTPILHIMSDHGNRTCALMHLDQGSPACAEAEAVALYSHQEQLRVANTTGNPIIRRCTEDACGLDMPLRMPEYVVRTIVDVFP